MNNEKEFALNLQSVAFEQFNSNLDGAITACLNEILAGNFNGGDITAKISIDIADASDTFKAGEDLSGRPIMDTYVYKTPTIDCRVALTLKKKSETKSSFGKQSMEIREQGGKYVITMIPGAQLTLDDLNIEE